MPLCLFVRAVRPVEFRWQLLRYSAVWIPQYELGWRINHCFDLCRLWNVRAASTRHLESEMTCFSCGHFECNCDVTTTVYQVIDRPSLNDLRLKHGHAAFTVQNVPANSILSCRLCGYIPRVVCFRASGHRALQIPPRSSAPISASR